MDDLEKAVELAELTRDVRVRYSQTESYHASLLSRYRRLHHYYAPIWGDQWPEDATRRPDKIHLTVNICKAACDVDARIQSILPRLSCAPKGIDAESRRRAEDAEKTILRTLELSDWEVWMGDLCKSKVVYGKGVLRVFWDNEYKTPSVEAVENPGNLRVGYGSSDFKRIDWVIYEFSLSEEEVERQFDIEVEVSRERGEKKVRILNSADHYDPLQTLTGGSREEVSRPLPRQQSDYEATQLRVWDYWYKEEDGSVWNAQFVEGELVGEPKRHGYLPDIPYIIIENDHEPGNPEGIATHEPIIDLQIELNRALSHWAQLVADEIDPAWQLTGDNADSVPAGTVPRSGEIVAAGAGNEIKPIPKGVNQFPIQQLIEEFWQEFYRITGLPEILFSVPPGAQTAGRALAMQIEAANNRLDLKRRALYAGLRKLIQYWVYMYEQKNPKLPGAVDEAGQPIDLGVGDIVGGFYRWKVIAPEITPRDAIENTTNTINQVNAKVISLKTARDLLGFDSPEDEEDLITEERNNVSLFPGEVMSKVSVMAAMQQMQMTEQQMQQMAGNPVNAAQDQAGPNVASAQQQQATPTGTEADSGMPMSLPGGAPPPGGPTTAAAGEPPNGSPMAQTLVRANPSTGQTQALNQIVSSRRL